MGTVKQEAEHVSVRKLFGKQEFCGLFIGYMADMFGPALRRVAVGMVLDGKSKEEVFEAMTTTAEAMVVGLRAAADKASKTHEDWRIPSVSRDGQETQDQQTEA